MSDSAFTHGLQHLSRLIAAAVERDRGGEPGHDTDTDSGGRSADHTAMACMATIPSPQTAQEAQEPPR